VDAINRFSTAQPAGRLTFNANEFLIRIDTLARPDELHRLLDIPIAAIARGAGQGTRGKGRGAWFQGRREWLAGWAWQVV
jgi:hypothetical protein